jgi:hypothetical protein
MLEHKLQAAWQMLHVWCWLVKCVIVTSPLIAYDRYVVLCLQSEEDLIFFSSSVFLSIFLDPVLLPEAGLCVILQVTIKV